MNRLTSTFMFNYRVDGLAAIFQALRNEGCDVLPKMDDSDHGTVGWIMDPQGNKVELWEPRRGGSACTRMAHRIARES